MLNEIIKDAGQRMDKSVAALRTELTHIRTGRANTALLDSIRVDYYGSDVPLSQVAAVSVADARTLSITPWEKNMVAPIEKAIISSDLGLNPTSAGTVIRIPLPPLTEERRRELGRLVGQNGEQGKVAVRNIRRDANHHIKDLLKEKEITEDEERRAEDEIQKLTDAHVKRVDEIVAEKETELMEI